EGTGIPAAMGAILMNQGKINTKGVLPPEGCVDPATFLALVPQVMSLDKSGGKSFEGVIVEHIDENGKLSKIDASAFLG
ncbi:MAG: hypothetical protein PHY31_02415, partial [Smithellaceae bacterium]|nr:hypothetical protein [Smithellaceae bacterium]